MHTHVLIPRPHCLTRSLLRAHDAPVQYAQIGFDMDLGILSGFPEYTRGLAFVASLGVTIALGILLALSNVMVKHLSDANEPAEKQRLTTFLAQVVYLCCMSSTAKGAYLTLHTVTLSLRGDMPTTSGSTVHLVVHLIEQGVFTAIAFFLLGTVVVSMQRDVKFRPELPLEANHYTPYGSIPFNERLLQIGWMESLIVYAWAFSFVNGLWEVLYTGVGYYTGYGWGQVFFWLVGGLLTSLSVLIAICNSPTGDDFYYINPAASGDWASSANMMMYWAVDFIVWWGWDELVSLTDTAAYPTAPTSSAMSNFSASIVALNFSLILGILVAMGLFAALSLKMVPAVDPDAQRFRKAALGIRGGTAFKKDQKVAAFAGTDPVEAAQVSAVVTADEPKREEDPQHA